MNYATRIAHLERMNEILVEENKTLELVVETMDARITFIIDTTHYKEFGPVCPSCQKRAKIRNIGG